MKINVELRSASSLFLNTLSPARSTPRAASSDTKDGTLTWSGGLELLFGRKQKFEFEFGDEKSLTMKDLLFWMRNNHCKERPDLFVTDCDMYLLPSFSSLLLQGTSLKQNKPKSRPGILVLINEADWELENRLEYVLQNGDSIALISTLHGG